MEISSIASQVTGMVQGAGGRSPSPPTEITKDGLIAMRDRAKQDGREAPEGIDTLIENFDEAAGEDGSMTLSQFKTYAKENGVTVPDAASRQRAGGTARPSGPPPGGGAPPAGGAPSAGKSGGASSSTSSTSSSKTDWTSLSEAELKEKAANGSLEAARELARREAMAGGTSSGAEAGMFFQSYM